jgi:hypothetical protein
MDVASFTHHPGVSRSPSTRGDATKKCGVQGLAGLIAFGSLSDTWATLPPVALGGAPGRWPPAFAGVTGCGDGDDMAAKTLAKKTGVWGLRPQQPEA